MYGTREGSIWKNLALAFGDGLAFGAGVNLSQNAAGRITHQGTNMRSLSERLNEIENRIEHARRTDTLPNAFSRKAVEAVIAVVDARLREQAVHFEQRLSTELATIRNDVAGSRDAGRQEAIAMHSEFTQSITKLVEEKIAESMRPVPQPAGPTDRELLEMVLSLGRLCVQIGERLAPVTVNESACVNGDPGIQPAIPAPAPAKAVIPEPAPAPPKAFWRLPLVSSFFVVTGGLLLLHYL